ncbi:MAG: Flp pilus assembly complex ATPase component TadA [Planctomycetes bacterium]|jgi:type IV pilus assembly protein PilB|nr:Flp pilus assembly complex ATPase component TadA [Planctomycetota bacterium]
MGESRGANSTGRTAQSGTSARGEAAHANTQLRHAAHAKLGDILVKKGALRPDQLAHALEVQKTAGGLIGSVLVELGLVNDQALSESLAEALGLEFLDLNKLGVIEPDAARIVPENIARRHTLVGVRFVQPLPDTRDPTRLVVAMADPSDFTALDSIRASTGYVPIAAVATRGQIRDALATAYFESPLSLEEAVGELKDFRIEASGENVDERDFARIKNEAGLAPVVRYVNSMLFEAARMRASDIHVEPQEHDLRVRFRIDGDLRAVAPPPKLLQSAIISRLKIISGLDIAERRLPQDGRVKLRFLGRMIDVRVSTMPTAFGEKVVLRLLDQSATALDLSVLGFDEKTVTDMRRIIHSPHGIVLLCGPTGCGKSTTLYSFLRELNTQDVNIVTVEDPIEYSVAGVNQTHVHPKIGLTFASVLRTMLRQDPDIMMVGEMRDLETLEVGVRASLTGHLVLSTLHTNTAVSAVTRMVNIGLQPYLISATLLAALSQRLVRKVCLDCRELREPAPTTKEALERYFERDVAFKVPFSKGCDHCGHTGYKGRIAVSELFELNDPLREMISHGTEERAIEQRAREFGMQSLLDSAFRKLEMGLTSVDEVFALGFQKHDDIQKPPTPAQVIEEEDIPETDAKLVDLDKDR